jgi:flagellar FliL protein
VAKPASVKASPPTEASVVPIKKKRRLPLVLGVALAAAAVAGGAGWYFTHPSVREPAGEKITAAKPPLFHTLEPFTVNLAEENGDHYLQLSVVYQVSDDRVIEQMKSYLPIIRNRILLLLSAKHPSDLAGPDGKQKLVAELVAAARESIPALPDTPGVVGAYLGAFVIQ